LRFGGPSCRLRLVAGRFCFSAAIPHNLYLNKFVVVEITTTIRGIAEEVSLGPAEGLPKRCVANCDNVRTVARSMLAQKAGALAPSRQVEVKRALGHALGWSELVELPAVQ